MTITMKSWNIRKLHKKKEDPRIHNTIETRTNIQ